jgi:hypothetical protein
VGLPVFPRTKNHGFLVIYPLRVSAMTGRAGRKQPERYLQYGQKIMLFFQNEEPRCRAAGFFGREEKVLRTFLILYWGSATPPSLAQERTCGP